MLKDLFKSVIIYGFLSVVGRLVGLFLVPIYTRVFTPEQYGIIDLVETVIAIVAIFGSLHLESAVQRFYYEAENRGELKKYLSSTLWSILVLSSVCVLVIIISSKWLSMLLFNDPQYSMILIIASIKIPLYNLFIFTSVLIRYMKKPGIFSVFIILQIITTIGISIWLVVYRHSGIIGVFYGQLSGFIIALLLLLIYLRKYFAFIWDRNILKVMFSFSLPQVPARIGVIGNTYANRFLILGYLSLADIGLYTIAIKISSVFLLIQSAFSMGWYPFMYENLENEDHKKLFIKVSKYVTTLVLILVSIFALYSKEILMLITTKEYYAAAPLIGLLAFSFSLTIINNSINLGTLISKKTIYGTYAYLISAIFNVVLLFILIPRIGLIGVPISLLCANTVLLVISWFISEKLYYIGFDKTTVIIMYLITLIIVVGSIALDLSLVIKLLITLACMIYVMIYLANPVKQLYTEFLIKERV